MNEIPEFVETILTSLFAGEATDDEVETLREWLEASVEHRQWLEAYRNTHLFIRAYYSDNKNKYNVDAAWRRLELTKPELPRTIFFRLKKTLRYAAMILVAFLTGMTAMYFMPKEKMTANAPTEDSASFTEYTVPYGSKSQVILPDSSLIWLNAGSKLRYDQAFNRTTREVFIEGEAYFKVARNESKPFLVRTSTVTLKVLGTSFNIKAYREENNVETTVETGSVQVMRNLEGRLADELVLTAGQKAKVIKSPHADSMTYDAFTTAVATTESVMPEEIAASTVITDNVTTRLYTSWKDPRWLIEKESLETLAVKLERRYNVRISFVDESPKNFSFSGTFMNETLEQVLEAIKLSAPVNYTIHQNEIKLAAKKRISN